MEIRPILPLFVSLFPGSPGRPELLLQSLPFFAPAPVVPSKHAIDLPSEVFFNDEHDAYFFYSRLTRFPFFFEVLFLFPSIPSSSNCHFTRRAGSRFDVGRAASQFSPTFLGLGPFFDLFFKHLALSCFHGLSSTFDTHFALFFRHL